MRSDTGDWPSWMAMFAVASCLSGCGAHGPTWRDRAVQDLRAIHDILGENHPGPVDEDGAEFRRWHEHGLSTSLALAGRARSYAGYYFAVRHYVAGFRDGHVTLSSPPRLAYAWPGFVVSLRDGRFLIVRDGGEGGPSVPSVPPAGAELLSCDGKTPQVWMRDNVFAYRGDPTLEASATELAPWLLVDAGNPWVALPRECVFLERGQRVTRRLHFRSVDEERLAALVERASFGPPPRFEIRTVAPHAVWISLPTFSPRSDSDTELLRQAVRRMSDLRGERLLVFDVRGNRGGNSQWAEDLVQALFGEDYFRYRRSAPGVATEWADWRASADNEAHLRGLLGRLGREFSADAPIVRMVTELIDAMPEARRRGDPFVTYRDPPEPQRRPAGNPVVTRIFLLTDGRCGSACLDFADLLFAMGEVRHVGTATHADTNYGDVRGVALPGGILRLTFAMKVIRGRPRRSGQPYVPSERWSGDMSDTAGIEAFVLELAGR